MDPALASGSLRGLHGSANEALLNVCGRAPQACKAAGNGAHPRDYLNFFAPCKREVVGPDEPVPAQPCRPGSPQVPLLPAPEPELGQNSMADVCGSPFLRQTKAFLVF